MFALGSCTLSCPVALLSAAAAAHDRLLPFCPCDTCTTASSRRRLSAARWKSSRLRVWT